MTDHKINAIVRGASAAAHENVFMDVKRGAAQGILVNDGDELALYDVLNARTIVLELPEPEHDAHYGPLPSPLTPLIGRSIHVEGTALLDDSDPNDVQPVKIIVDSYEWEPKIGLGAGGHWFGRRIPHAMGTPEHPGMRPAESPRPGSVYGLLVISEEATMSIIDVKDEMIIPVDTAAIAFADNDVLYHVGRAVRVNADVLTAQDGTPVGFARIRSVMAVPLSSAARGFELDISPGL